MLKELSEDLNSIKKIQSETDYTLVKINNLQGNYSRVVEAKNQMIWNIRKQKTTNQNKKKKRIQKKNKDSVSSLWDNFKSSNILIKGVQKEKRKGKKLKIYLKK